MAWLQRLPALLYACATRWSLSVHADEPFEGSAAWVAPATRADGTPAVLKLGMPHMEADQEIDGLRFWAGDPTVELFEADDDAGAMLLERCTPGTSLAALPEAEQDLVIAALLHRAWRKVPAGPPFRPLAVMVAHWCNATVRDSARWPDAALVKQGLRLFEELLATTSDHVLLMTDLHAGNVLRAERQPWLVIDPKPFLGDPAFDATQHLFNCRARLAAEPDATIGRIAEVLRVDAERARLWMFARLAAEPRDDWDDDTLDLARAIRPQ